MEISELESKLNSLKEQVQELERQIEEKKSEWNFHPEDILIGYFDNSFRLFVYGCIYNIQGSVVGHYNPHTGIGISEKWKITDYYRGVRRLGSEEIYRMVRAIFSHE